MHRVSTPDKLTAMAKELFREERARTRLDGWFLAKEIRISHEDECADAPRAIQAAYLLKKVCEELPLSISESAIFAGTQRDAFARSYALINPSFRVESFAGYCDPIAVLGDIEPNEDITKERIDAVRAHDADTPYAEALRCAYAESERYTAEVAYFMEQVTGHVIPDVRTVIDRGICFLRQQIEANLAADCDSTQQAEYEAMLLTIDALLILAGRYAAIAKEQLGQTADPERRAQLQKMIEALEHVPAFGARSMYEAIQSFMLCWQLMCLEQSPNPFAFSVGNADRIFEPYREKDALSREQAAALLKHLLVFFNVGDRSWAISQNLIIGGKDTQGNDLTCPTSYALFDAYYDMNLPQPILSVKLHKNTPTALYREMGRFFFSPGTLTPSLFNDDAMFAVLRGAGIEEEDLPDYSIAGCQEPLIMGRDNGNTTNCWLNLGKILELTLTDGVSAITGKTIGSVCPKESAIDTLRHLRQRFYENAQFFIEKMVHSANQATAAVSLLPVPFLSILMGGVDTGYDMRDIDHQGTKYNGSGCLIHGNTVVSDSFVAVDHLLEERPQDAELLLEALRANFVGYEELRTYLLQCPKFGNNLDQADREATEVTSRIADMVRAQKNNLGNPFRPDFSTPSTHLLYGYWVGALPTGRKARDMLNYGVDPLYGDAHMGLGFRTLSTWKLPFEKFCGGYASHFGIDPNLFPAPTLEEKGEQFANRVCKPLFFNEHYNKVAPFYLYVNVTTPEILRKVLANPEKYAPSGVYIMRIHGTFVNFLDLSAAIQQDIITRLDLHSTHC
ncbi:MAG: pyruvate formate lyase family protein [Eubacteriales bacterium]|nr:pyruvate formate lyase family protein [Eubacteriales bacterium]